MSKHFVAMVFLVLLVGCTGTSRDIPKPLGPTTVWTADSELTEPVYLDAVRARVDPPTGWRADPLKASEKHQHQVWISPGGHTAYGVIHFELPFPVGHEWTLVGFLQNMKKAEGEATLISKQWDDQLPGLRFVAEGGLYRVRTNLQVRGTEGWATYAGTLRKEAVNESELMLAEAAREGTVVGEFKSRP